MQDLKDLKRRFFQKRFRRRAGANPANPRILQILIQTIRGIARDRPSRYGKRGRFGSVGRGPVPRRARGAMNVREGQALALRESRKREGQALALR